MAGKHSHPRANRGTAHALTQAADCACDLHAKGEGRRRRILVLALDHQQIGEVQTARRDFNQHLTFARRGCLDFNQGRGAVKVTYAIGTHLLKSSLLPSVAG